MSIKMKYFKAKQQGLTEVTLTIEELKELADQETDIVNKMNELTEKACKIMTPDQLADFLYDEDIEREVADHLAQKEKEEANGS